MTPEEFSNSFDTLLDSFTHRASFGEASSKSDLKVDEYEKSVLLTLAQEEVALSLYTGRNSSGNSFDETEELRRYLSSLIKEAELEPLTKEEGQDFPIGISTNSKFFQLPSNLWFITYESINISNGKCAGMTSMDVYPATQDEYNRIKRNPFRGANDRRALRLDLSDNQVEIVSKYTATKYYIRYIRRLKPIIVAPLDGLSIDGVGTVSPCELPASIHKRILERAVDMAIQRGSINKSNNN